MIYPIAMSGTSTHSKTSMSLLLKIRLSVCLSTSLLNYLKNVVNGNTLFPLIAVFEARFSSYIS